MTTPTKEAILKKARELFMENSVKNGVEPISPTNKELLESGYFATARSMLMRDRNRAQIEEYFADEDQLSVSEFSFDTQEALQNGVYISGTSGSGKSDLAMMHADEMMKADVSVIVFDATRDWIKRSSVPYYVTVHPDDPKIPLTLNGKSIVYDMSLLNPFEQKILVKRVCKAVWNHQVQRGSHWYFLIFEEGHIYFPQGCMRSKQYADMVQLVTGGRNYMIRFEVITQFSSMVDKDVMKYMKQRYFSYTDEPNDIGYVTDFLASREPEKRRYEDRLKSLKSGQFLYKHGNEVSLVEIEPFQSQCTPQPLQVHTPKPQPKRQTKTVSESSTVNYLIAMTQLGSLAIFVILVFSLLLNLP